MLKISDLNLSIGPVPILHDVNLAVETGSMCGVIGRNGAGKTTLLRAIMGLLPLRSGQIAFDDAELTCLPAHHRAALGIGYLPEDRRLVPEFTVGENIQVSLWATRNPDETRLAWVKALIPEIVRLEGRRCLTLSGGQQKLVALARAMVTGTRLILLDEPFEGIAPALAQRLIEVISNLKSQNLTILISESDYTHSEHLVDKLYTIERGQVSTQTLKAA